MKTPGGFIELQLNGWKGVNLTSAALTVEQVTRMTRELKARGVLAYCPTVITAPTNVLKHSLETIARAAALPENEGRLVGIHLEGPFISPEFGAVGAHPIDYVRQPDPAVFDRFQGWAEGRIRLLTLAPERPGAPDLIRHAKAQGVAVSIGHHLASDEDVAAAVRAGVTLCTHVGNGLPNEIHRHNNVLWGELANDDLSGMFITDGQHLPVDMIKVALRAKTPDRFIVTSDASPLAGLPAGRYDLEWGLSAIIDEAGRIYSEKTQCLVGSHADMLTCMNRLASLNLLNEDELWRVGFHNPLRALGLDPDSLPAGGPRAVFRDGRFVV
jgi:N-acetylglucosamine-6-phosphate deacetylase